MAENAELNIRKAVLAAELTKLMIGDVSGGDARSRQRHVFDAMERAYEFVGGLVTSEQQLDLDDVRHVGDLGISAGGTGTRASTT